MFKHYLSNILYARFLASLRGHRFVRLAELSVGISVNIIRSKNSLAMSDIRCGKLHSFIFIYTSLFTKMVASTEKKNIHTNKNIQ